MKSSTFATPAKEPLKRPMRASWIRGSALSAVALGLLLSCGLAWQRVSAARLGQDEKPAGKQTLIEDGRIGKVIDVQGVAGIKPVMRQRWTPVTKQLLLKPGDWLRTEPRGANAVALQLVTQAHIILGPGTLVELAKGQELRVQSGELEITALKGTTVELLGPDKQRVTVEGTQRYRVDQQKLVTVAQEPLWLKGFKGATANESLGSLIASVDGRNVPLTVGYHKVSVDIRDQIARTVIEESFVNHTDAQLEGVFYFPLPQDASISGFGMWIGENLIEADVVEKQRAREIYETILRESRDPGLLEWQGGNIFKARVFPIFARSEKRIKITYTQVLPLQGNRYRYSYALQSEMLRQHPLRELAIDVKVNSVLPLKSVTSPTHDTRTEQTAHSGHVEFSAMEYTPARDFEVVIEIHGRQGDVVLIPHRRGEDGYFMLHLIPPAGAETLDRDLLPDGEPLQLLILADTSASMDTGQRGQQAAFLSALLGSLTSKDSFNIAACDVECDWIFEKPVPAEPATLTAVHSFLANRASLGWTNLDKAFASAFQRANGKTQIIYLGDGIVTARVGDKLSLPDADPIAFSKRLRRSYEGSFPNNKPEPGPICHAVAVGNSYESGVMKAIGSLGGGSTRRISGEQGPQVVALDLLREIAQPALRDLKVEFHGLRPARVYPELLPNVAAGSQQIVLGRYLAEGGDQAGEVIVTGKQGDKAIRFSKRVSLKDAEQGNSFIPRLWARSHLDYLLEQGSSESIKDEIIALSEEYHIITPYTSLLVLETDADRERFGVKRRFAMRDGEKFFAQGRDNATYELVQKQMKRAGAWRAGLLRNVLQELAGLGRNSQLFQAGGGGRRSGGLAGVIFGDTAQEYDALPLSISGPAGGLPAFGFVRDFNGFEERLAENAGGDVRFLGSLAAGAREEPAFEGALEIAARDLPVTSPEPAELFPGLRLLSEGESLIVNEDAGLVAALDDSLSMSTRAGRGLVFGGGEYSYFGRSARHDWPGRYTQWVDTLFPSLPAVSRKGEQPKPTWPEPARALAQSLLRLDKLLQLKGGIEVVRQTESYTPRWNELTGRSQKRELYSPTLWLTRAEGDGAQTLVHWSDGKERGVFSPAFQLGRVRNSTPDDLRTPPLDVHDSSLTSLELSYAGYTPELKPQGKDRTLLVLKQPANPRHAVHILVDTARHVILSIEQRQDDKFTWTTRVDDFVEVAGCWWAQRIEGSDAEGRRVSLIAQTIRALSAEAFAQRVKQELAGRDEVLFLRQPLPTVAAAKNALAKLGELTFDIHLTLILHHARSQQWTRVVEHLQQAEQLAAGKPGIRWVRNAVLDISRRHEELKKRLVEEARQLSARRERGGDALFLAHHVLGQASSVCQANEMLALLDTLEPLYQRQPTYRQAMKSWLQMRVRHLQQAGQTEAAVRVLKELASDYPRDYDTHRQYAQAVAGSGDYDTAYAWLSRVLTREAKWSTDEEESLRGTYAGLLEVQGRYSELVDYLTRWIRQEPETQTPYQQYLTALIRDDQAERANALINRWLAEGLAPGEPKPAVVSRLRAAVSQALGQGHTLHTNRLDERWLKPLADAALVCVRDDARRSLADQIMSHGRFQQSDECRRVRKVMEGILTKDIDKLPVDQLYRFVEWILPNDPAIAMEVWKRLADGLRQRWTVETRPDLKSRLGQPLVHLLERRFDPEDVLAFLRLQWREGPKEYRTAYANQRFDALLEQPWSAEHEDEAFALLDKLSEVEEPGRRLVTQVGALHRLTDKMLQARFAALMKTVEHQEKLTRIELQKKKEEDLRQARQGLVVRLNQELSKASGGRKAPGDSTLIRGLTPPARQFVNWLTIERLYLDVLLERDPKQIAAECWQLLGDKPAPSRRADGEEDLTDRLATLLQERYLTTLMYLAARRSADPALVERLLKYVDQAIAADPDDNRWKLHKYRLLVALDRPKELEQSLQKWVGVADPLSQWRLSLAHVLAEQGRVPEAIKLIEAVESASELGPTAYRTLADWYMTVNQREQHERAAVAAYKTLDEWRLSRQISTYLNPWQRRDGHLPSELDKEVLLVFAALFENSNRPQDYLGQLQQFYQASRDFRLLAGLADAVVGHTAAKVYPFLQGMQGVLSELREEATADELLAHLRKVRARAKTAVDQRALDLLEAMVERRAAEVLNQPGPHAEAALQALVRAFKHEWSPGEPRLMADLLAHLGAITQKPLAQEQLRQLQVLHGRQAEDSYDRLHIALRWASTVHAYARTAPAIDILLAALGEFRDANQGVLPTTANDALGTLITFHEGAGYHTRGERILLAALQRPVHPQQALWLTQRLYRLYLHALQRGDEVSLGSGRVLYQAIERRMRDELATADHDHRSSLIDLLCQTYRAAQGKKVSSVSGDLRAFAFRQLPRHLRVQTNHHDSIVRQVGQTLHDLAGPRDGLAFLIERIEQEPGWLKYNNQDGWQQHGSQLAWWRQEVKDLGDLEVRLLKLVRAELRRDLETGEHRSRYLYHRHYSYYWSEKAEAFAQTADAVLSERGQSGATVQYVSEYYYTGLDRPGRAIEVLFAARGRKVLNETGQAQLVRYLHEQKRHAESIPLLQPLMKEHPENLQYRVWLMHAYFRTKRQEDLLALLKETDVFFHEKDRWTPNILAQLGKSCLENQLYERAVAYYNELIPLHQRNRPGRGVGDGTLANYYMELAQAQAGLGKTAAAVDAASGAVVSWGPRHEQRTQALETLRQVLRQSADLVAYAGHLGKESRASGQDKPIVRKALGQVFLEKAKYAEAIQQLELAVQLQPNDHETHQLLVTCYDKRGDQEGVVRQLLNSVQLARRDFKLYEELGRRLTALSRAREVERAYTSIIEVVPNESEGHALLAEIREKQNRWPDAIAHWEQVAQIRSLEPTGLLKLAAAQIHDRQWDQAMETVRRLRVRTWPQRFGNVTQQVHELERKIDQVRQK